jgi:DNA-binding Lrp family transcriptional regulator
MMRQFLKIIKDGGVLSQLEIARRLKVSPDLVLQMAKDLAGRGYLAENGGACESSQVGCSGCPASSACQVAFRQWSITEKGERVLG